MEGAIARVTLTTWRWHPWRAAREGHRDDPSTERVAGLAGGRAAVRSRRDHQEDHREPDPALAGRARQPRCRLAGGQLPRRGPDLSARQPAPAGGPPAGAAEAAAPRPLGHDARTELHLRAPESRDQAGRPGHDLRLRSGARRAGDGRQHVSRGELQRAVPQRVAGRGRDAVAVPPVLLPRRDPEPRGAGDPRVDPRGGRARVRAGPCLRRGVRQSGVDRGLRRGRWGSGDGPIGDGLALEQVPQPRHRRGGAPRPAPERLQDRQPHDPRPHSAGRAGPAPGRLRLHAPLGRGLRARRDAPADGRGARHRPCRDPSDPARGARHRDRDASPLADDRAQDLEGLDRAQRGGRPADRRIMALAPGAAGRLRPPPGASPGPGGLDAELSARSAVRRAGDAAPGRDGAGAGRAAPHGREPPRQRGAPSQGPEDARLPDLRRRRDARRVP